MHTRGPMRSSFLVFALLVSGCGGLVDDDLASSGDPSAEPSDSGTTSTPVCSDRSLKPIATISSTAVAVATDTAFAYLALRGSSGDHDGSIVKVPLAGGSPITISSGDESPMGLALDAGSVYFTSGGSGHSAGVVTRVGKDGSAKTVLARGLEWPNGIAVDDAAVYWAEGGNGDGSAEPDGRVGARVMRLDKGSGVVLPLAIRQRNPESVAVDATHLYWTNSGGAAGLSGGVMRVLKTGGTPQILAKAEDAIPATYPSSGIALSATDVFWTSTKSGRVMAVPKLGGAPREVSLELEGPLSVATDATFVYWTNPWTRSVRRAPLGGGPVETVVESRMAPWAISTTSDRVFVTNYVNGGSLDSTCKPR